MTILKGRAFSNRRYKAIALHQCMSYVIHMSVPTARRKYIKCTSRTNSVSLCLCVQLYTYSLYSSSYSIHRIKTGIINKSLIKAVNKVTLIIKPTVTLAGLIENSITRNPKNKITEVKQIAFPVSRKVI